jgi:chlorophyll synthase
LGVLGLILAGPLVCATSQAVNDWFDRHVDAINEPDRPIPSGRVPGRWGLWIAIIGTVVSACFALTLGVWVFAACVVGLGLAWAYSAPPLRLKQHWLWGPAAVALSYEGLAWFTGAALMTGGFPSTQVVALAALYSIGAHGIMTLNDFKAVEGDRQMGIASAPVRFGVDKAARIACAVMAAPQLVVIGCLFLWGRPAFALGVAVLLGLQAVLMSRLIRDPRRFAPWYNATGTTLYVLGMMVSAVAVSPFVGGAP